MLKVLHTADLHFDNKPDVLVEVVRCSDFLLNTAEKERPEAALITGDLVDQRLYMDSAGSLAALSFVKRLAAICPVLLIKGTELHDFDSLKVLTGLPNVMVVDDVRQVCFSRKLGFYHADVPGLPEGFDPMCDADMVVSCLPSLSKAFLVSLGRDGDTAQEEIQNLVGDVLRGWGDINRELRGHGVATVLGAHGTIAGSVTSTGQVMVGHDITYGTDDLRAADCDYYGFGHIHKMQKVGPAYYCGSIGRLNAGEQEEKGFFMLDIEPGIQAKPRFIKTPAREFIILDLGKDPENWQDALKAELAGREITENTVIKVKASVSELNASSLIRKDVETVVGREVMFEKSVIPLQRTRAEGISKLVSLRDKYIKYAECAGLPTDEGMLTRIDMMGLPEEELTRMVVARIENGGELPILDSVVEPAAEEHTVPTQETVFAKDSSVPVAAAPVKKKRVPRKVAQQVLL